MNRYGITPSFGIAVTEVETVKITAVKQPSDTIALTERISASNLLGSSYCWSASTNDTPVHPGARINYLFCDGSARNMKSMQNFKSGYYFKVKKN